MDECRGSEPHHAVEGASVVLAEARFVAGYQVFAVGLDGTHQDWNVVRVGQFPRAEQGLAQLGSGVNFHLGKQVLEFRQDGRPVGSPLQVVMRLVRGVLRSDQSHTLHGPQRDHATADRGGEEDVGVEEGSCGLGLIQVCHAGSSRGRFP